MFFLEMQCILGNLSCYPLDIAFTFLCNEHNAIRLIITFCALPYMWQCFPVDPDRKLFKHSKSMKFQGQTRYSILQKEKKDCVPVCPLYILSCDLEKQLQLLHDKINSQLQKRDIFKQEWRSTIEFGGRGENFSLLYRILIKCRQNIPLILARSTDPARFHQLWWYCSFKEHCTGQFYVHD